METKLLVAIGDLHGNYNALNEIVTSLNNKYDLIKDNKIREDAMIVTTGDYIDRGMNGIKILENLIQLQKDNPNNYFPLIGNHELMALEAFDLAKDLHKNKEMSLENYLEIRHGFNGGINFLVEFGKEGEDFLENYVKRMAIDGDLGQWIRGLIPTKRIEFFNKRFLFTHAGIPKNLYLKEAFEKYSEDYQKNIEAGKTGPENTFIRYGSHFILKEGVFWDREFEQQPKPQIDKIAESLGFDYLVLGHTPNEAIKVYSDRLINIDVGMASQNGENLPYSLVASEKGIFEHRSDGLERLLISF